MTDQPVCLTLIVPHQLRDEVFDCLTEQTDLISGFTASHGAGHGAEVRLHTAAERVKGHADQAIVQVILASSDASRLLDRLRISFAGTRIIYWAMPVAEFGTID
jgi:5,10-methylenetetrahydrofolate reductase